MRKVRDPWGRTVGIVVRTVLMLVVVLGLSLMIVLWSLAVRLEF
jgi:hypothetical protein